MRTLPKVSSSLHQPKVSNVFIALFLITSAIYESCSIMGPPPLTGVGALRVQGKYDLGHDFFLFLAKFAFQKTEVRDPNNTQGFIYGNITVADNTDGIQTSQHEGNETRNTIKPGKAKRGVYYTI